MSELDTIDIEIKLLLEGIFLKYKDDFRNYTISSVRRRVHVALDQLGIANVSSLQNKVLNEVGVYERLLDYLTVPTSEMFRDPAYFRAIREQVVPLLRTYPSIKIWIAGCSTGEEVFSFAILLKEEGLLDRSIIYATDISSVRLKKARMGIFPLVQLPRYTENYQKAGGKMAFSSYYGVVFDAAAFDPALSANVVFADHSLATDSVFAEVQLISCRNVLIYFDRTLQERVIKLFSDSLGYRGFLGLGSKESLRFSDTGHHFAEFSRSEKVFRKKGAGE